MRLFSSLIFIIVVKSCRLFTLYLLLRADIVLSGIYYREGAIERVEKMPFTATDFHT